MSNPHRISLLQNKAWSIERTSHGLNCTRSFGAPERVRFSSRTMFCVHGDDLPSRMVLNGLDIPIMGNESGKFDSEIGKQLVERNKVALVWCFDEDQQLVRRGFDSLREIYLEIWE